MYASSLGPARCTGSAQHDRIALARILGDVDRREELAVAHRDAVLVLRVPGLDLGEALGRSAAGDQDKGGNNRQMERPNAEQGTRG